MASRIIIQMFAMSSEKPVLCNLLQCFPCPTASHVPFYPPVTPLVLLLTDKNHEAYCKGNKPSETLLLDVRASESIFTHPGSIFCFHRSDRFCSSYIPQMTSTQNILNDTCFHLSVTDLGPEDPMFHGIVWLIERGHLQVTSSASDIKKPHHQNSNLPKSKLNNHSSAFWGKPLTVHFSIVMIQLGELEGNLFTG